MKPDNPPAFPSGFTADGQAVNAVNEGMTLRDHFAGLVMQGMIANPNFDPTFSEDWVAANCYLIADAMLAARGK